MKICLTSDLHRGCSNKTVRHHEAFFLNLKVQEFDVLVLAGDLCSHKQEQLESLFKHMRQYLPDTKVLALRGNHDYWNDGTRQTLGVKLSNWTEQCKKYGVESMEPGTTHHVGFNMIYGWSNWYGTPRHLRSTNDEKHITIEEEKVLYDADLKGFEEIPLCIDILVTHMPIISDGGHHDIHAGSLWQWGWLKDKGMLPRVYMHGHTHKERDEIIDGTRVVMCGSDYDKPKYKIIEV